MADYRKYAYDYWHEGARWSFTLMATSFEDAEARRKQLQYARLAGLLVAEIPHKVGFLAKCACWIANALRREGR